MTRNLILTALICLSTAANADDIVEKSLNQADRLWDKTVEYAGAKLEQVHRFWREDHPEAARLWEQLMPHLDEAIALREREPRLPETAWFGEDRASNEARLNTLLDEVSTILVGNNNIRQRSYELANAMRENRQAISRLKQRRLVAPSDSLWRKSVADIDEEIGEREAMLADQEQAMVGLYAELAVDLRARGMEIDAEGTEFLLSTVVGDEVVDMALAFQQVRELTAQLETLTVDSDEDLPTARRYYGMYAVLLQTLDHMHGTLLDSIESDYHPRIVEIGERARQLQQQTRVLNARGPSRVLEANLQAQQLTIDAAKRYSDYLERQRQQIGQSRRRLSRDVAVAQNTYETVKMSGDLVALMQDSRQRLDSLFRLQVPPLRAFENLDMKREFQRLTLRLRQDEA